MSVPSPADAESPSSGTASNTPHGIFATTHWSVVLTAGQGSSTSAQSALATLCHTYWRPIYAYVRRRGYSPHDAEDLTQAFFAQLLERNDVASVSPDRGKFRSYLLGAMNHFLLNEWDRARAKKRGGGRVIEMDPSVFETIHAQQCDDALTPEQLYDQRWAITLLEEAHRRLQAQYERDGNGALFAALRFSLMGERGDVRYAELGDQLHVSEGALRVAAHRMRQRYRRLLRELIGETVSSPDEVEAELRDLLKALSGD